MNLWVCRVQTSGGHPTIGMMVHLNIWEGYFLEIQGVIQMLFYTSLLWFPLDVTDLSPQKGKKSDPGPIGTNIIWMGLDIRKFLSAIIKSKQVCPPNHYVRRVIMLTPRWHGLVLMPMGFAGVLDIQGRVNTGGMVVHLDLFFWEGLFFRAISGCTIMTLLLLFPLDITDSR